MKKLVIAGMCMFTLLLGGCSKTSQTKGEVVTISVDEMKTKMDKKESFVIIFTQPTCGYCKKVMTMLNDEYLETHPITVYDVILDRNSETEAEFQAEIDAINVYFPQMKGTPDLYNVKDGAIVSQFDADTINMFEATEFDHWVNENKLL